MEIVSSYGVEIVNKDVFRYFVKTKEYYNTALSWLIQFYAPHIKEINAAAYAVINLSVISIQFKPSNILNSRKG